MYVASKDVVTDSTEANKGDVADRASCSTIASTIQTALMLTHSLPTMCLHAFVTWLFAHLFENLPQKM